MKMKKFSGGQKGDLKVFYEKSSITARSGILLLDFFPAFCIVLNSKCRPVIVSGHAKYFSFFIDIIFGNTAVFSPLSSYP